TASQAAEAAAAGSLSTSGLSFDSDLEKAFPTKPVEVQPQQRYSYRMNDNTYMGRQVEPEEETPPAPAAPEDEYTEEQAKIKDYARNYFAVNAGGLSASLKINLLKDIEAGELIKEVGGAGVTFGAQYQRRLTDRLWLGGVLNIGLIPQNITEASPQLQIKTTGQIIDFDILFGFYLNPKSKTRLYLLGGGGLSSVNIDKNAVRLTDPGGPNEGWVPLESQSAKSSGFGALFGAGIERSVMDINLALELRGQYNSLSRDFEGSRKINYYALLKAGWFF
ncbi:MAG: hypothetical protein LBR90_00885, partial [Elusimicrobiota bacterium]|nr:hypothetical protein [Elusimicrobiota bacterium]